MVVGRAYSVSWGMSELKLDLFVDVALLVEDRRGQPAEAVSGHHAFVSHPLESFQNGVVAHRFFGVAVSGKEPLAVTG